MSTLAKLIAEYNRVLVDLYRAEAEAPAAEYPKWYERARSQSKSYADRYLQTMYGPGGGVPLPGVVTGGPGGASADDYEVRMVNYPGFWPGYALPKEERPTLPAPAPAVAPPRCECGSGEANCHSDWCPLWRKDGR